MSSLGDLSVFTNKEIPERAHLLSQPFKESLVITNRQTPADGVVSLIVREGGEGADFMKLGLQNDSMGPQTPAVKPARKALPARVRLDAFEVRLFAYHITSDSRCDAGVSGGGTHDGPHGGRHGHDGKNDDA